MCLWICLQQTEYGRVLTTDEIQIEVQIEREIITEQKKRANIVRYSFRKFQVEKTSRKPSNYYLLIFLSTFNELFPHTVREITSSFDSMLENFFLNQNPLNSLMDQRLLIVGTPQQAKLSVGSKIAKGLFDRKFFELQKTI